MILRPNLSTPQTTSRSVAPKAAPSAEPTQTGPQDSASLGEYKPGELLLRTRPGFSLASDNNSVVDSLGAQVLGSFDTPGGIHKSETGEFLHLKLPAGVSVEQAMAKLADDPRGAPKMHLTRS